MKKIAFTLLLLMNMMVVAYAQRKQIDSLKAVISKSIPDTTKLKALLDLSNRYWRNKPDTAIRIVQQAFVLAESNKSEPFKARCIFLLARLYNAVGDYGKGMQLYLKVKNFFESINDTYTVIAINNNMGNTYRKIHEYKKALQYLYTAKRELDDYIGMHKNVALKFKNGNVHTLTNIGECYLYTHQTDSAEIYFNKAFKEEKQYNFQYLRGELANDLGEVEVIKGNRAAALNYFNRAAAFDLSENALDHLDFNYLSMAKMYQKYNQPDSAVYYALQAFSSARKGNFPQDVLDASKLLSTLYDQQHNIPQAYKYNKMSTQVNDSLFNQDKVRELLAIDFEEKQRQQEIAAAKEAYINKVRIYIFIAGLTILLLLVFVISRNSMQRQKANKLLHKQNDEIQSALSRLRLTQTQLIQSEKMASLGELTAGIAHEIQNPLNFVNNFSEVSKELLEELKYELAKGDIEEAKLITDDVIQNLEKINHHGKRADAIVKGMLEHSRASSGKKEPTDINALADEYLRLSYHGLRSKDKSFNAELLTNFEAELPPVNVIPQDIGRVLLNLFNNAFYAVNQKSKTTGGGYKPEVSVTTSHENGKVTIVVKDNGTGIPDNIKEKIMQPFFTTKPTGEGTGLGLSLSYDIVVKGHGGTITVDTTENEFTEFTLKLPIS